MGKTFTYTADPGNNEIDFIRDRIGDTDDEEPLLWDEEINAEIALQPSLLWAAAKCAEKLRNRFARYVTGKIGNDSESLSDRFKHYQQMVIDLTLAAEIADQNAVDGDVIPTMFTLASGCRGRR